MHFSGYFPSGYNPMAQPPKTDPLPELSPLTKQRAKAAGASHISPDGSVAYRLRFGKIERSYGSEGWASWWVGEEAGMIEGVIEL